MATNRAGVTTVAAAITVLVWSGCNIGDDSISPVCTSFTAGGALPSLWTQLKTPTAPPGRASAAAAYDDANDRLIVFGGATAAKEFTNDVWVLSNATDTGGAAAWTALAPTGTPPSPREGSVAAYDGADDLLVVFGGGTDDRSFADVSLLAHASGTGGTLAWSALPTSGAPGTAFASAAYVAANGSLVVAFGKQNANAASDVWVLSHANGQGGAAAWAKVDGGAAPARLEAAAVLDASNDRMLVFAGDRSSSFDGDFANDVWSLGPLSSGSPTFTALSSTTPSPPARAGGSLVFDEATGRATAFGGTITFESQKLLVNDVFVLSTKAPVTWASYATGNPPPARYEHVAGYSSTKNRMVVFGGFGYTGGSSNPVYFADTWVLDNANGAPASPPTSIKVANPVVDPAYLEFCTNETMQLTAEAVDGPGTIESVPVVWSCSDPSIVSAGGLVTGGVPENVTCMACLPDGSLCSPPVPIDVEIDGSSSSSSSSSSGGSSGSSGSSGGTCPGGFLASERSCIDDGGTCTCNDFPCSACIQSSDFPLAKGSALGEGQPGCIDTDGSLTGSVGTVVKPCAPGLCCLVGGACGGGGSRCGQCLTSCN